MRLGPLGQLNRGPVGRGGWISRMGGKWHSERLSGCSYRPSGDGCGCGRWVGTYASRMDAGMNACLVIIRVVCRGKWEGCVPRGLEVLG